MQHNVMLRRIPIMCAIMAVVGLTTQVSSQTISTGVYTECSLFVLVLLKKERTRGVGCQRGMHVPISPPCSYRSTAATICAACLPADLTARPLCVSGCTVRTARNAQRMTCFVCERVYGNDLTQCTPFGALSQRVRTR